MTLQANMTLTLLHLSLYNLYACPLYTGRQRVMLASVEWDLDDWALYFCQLSRRRRSFRFLEISTGWSSKGVFSARWYAQARPVPPSGVRPSVTFMYCVETSKHIVKLFVTFGYYTILVFPYQTLLQYSYACTPYGGGSQVQQGVLNNRYFRPISYFVSEMIQYRTIVTMERLWELVCDQIVPFSMILNHQPHFDSNYDTIISYAPCIRPSSSWRFIVRLLHVATSSAEKSCKSLINVSDR